jgi:hypothetical protein
MRPYAGVLAAATGAALLAAIAAVPSDAAVRKHPVYRRSGAFDGLWSVLIQTRSGPCDPAYRYPARIIGGQVVQAGNDFSYQLAGAVAASGAIAVTVSRSGQSATGYGRLTGARGAGRWQTAGGQCYGVWSAARRG